MLERVQETDGLIKSNIVRIGRCKVVLVPEREWLEDRNDGDNNQTPVMPYVSKYPAMAGLHLLISAAKRRPNR